jgi:hypothetical protein
VITYDRRGFGHSSQPSTSYDYDLIDLADHPLLLPRRGGAAQRGPIRRRAHQGLGRHDRLLRRVRLRHPRVQPLHLRVC